MIEKYWRRYPLDDFICWTMKWGQCLLVKYLEAKSKAGSLPNEYCTVDRNEKIGRSYDKKICLINQNRMKINSANNYDSDQATDRQESISRNEVHFRKAEYLLSAQALKGDFHHVERIGKLDASQFHTSFQTS